MNRKWIIAGASVLVVAAAAPWGVGYLTEHQWQEVTREVNESQPFMRMETDAYRRGVLGADIEAVVIFEDPETGESHRFDIRADVTHGLTGSLLDIRPAQGWSPPGENWFADAEPSVTLETRIWGSATLELRAPETEVHDPHSGETLATSGALVRVDIGSAGSRADAVIELPSLRIAGPEMELAFTDLQATQSVQHLTGEVWVGDGEFRLSSVVAAVPGQEQVTLTGMSMTSRSAANEDGSRLQSRVDFGLTSVQVTGQPAYGPHRLSFELENLDVESWSAVASGMSELQTLAMQAPETAASFEAQMALMERIGAAMRNLAAAGFSAGFPELMVTTPEGEIRGELSIQHPQLTEEEAASMLMVMQRLTGNLNLSLPLALTEEYPDFRLQLAPLIKQGLLVPQGDRLVMDARMQDLVVDVNGVEVPLPPLL